MGVWKRLFQVMFYVGIPLTIPAAYGYYAGEPIWQAIAASAILLMLPALPSIIAGGFGRVAKFLGGVKYWILKRNEKSWNEGVAEGLSEIGKKMEGMTLGEALCLTSIAWLLIPAITIIPYIYAGLAPEDAYFESMSTWTATGLSVVDTPEAYPSSLLLFRSVSQWIGGLGIVILMIAVLKGREARTLLKAEGREGVEKSVGKTVHTYWKIYLVLSVLGFALLFSLGFGIFDAVNLAMAGISNGGMFPFSSYDFTDAHKYALAGLMFAGATSFVFYKKVGSGRIMEAVRDEEFLTYILLIIAGSGLIYLVGQENLTNSILNTISALACGGFAIGDVMVMHDFSKYSLMLLMICGGMYGSTTGAIKLWRILIVGKSILLRIRRSFLPQGAVQVPKVNGIAIGNEALVESAVFVFSYTALLLFGAGVFIALGDGVVESMFLVASAMGNVGLSVVQISSMAIGEKLFITLLMYLGRIEIFPSLALARLAVGLAKR